MASVVRTLISWHERGSFFLRRARIIAMSPQIFKPFRAGLALLCAAAPITGAHAFESYRITGVAAADKLVVREEPFDGGKLSDWKEIASLPADTKDVLGTGRSKSVGAQRWFEVVVGETRGWVNGKFLEAGDPADLKTETFSCSGTEPFWGVTLGPSKGEYSDPESKTKLTTESVQPSTARLFPLLYRLKDASGQKYQATVSRQSWCSDGMSDYDYAFEVLLSNDEVFQQGCCVINR
ncbi:hypothetical protein [Hyphomicrobium sp. CS1GBMeth3]|uniref:hypothetical protein n=1 Tax=Hyphomicrobium sp. CS1GBMeth3 TaxID=1892845 RepID=UPI000931572A|nr:hypothetical protein [Hyphomicrobium sp. CS1GBMeth3]